MKIRYITPFATDKNIGKEYNAVIDELPDDCYVVLRDGDTLFLTSEWGKQIENIIKDNPNFDVITCKTNRITTSTSLEQGMFDITDMDKHVAKAKELQSKYGAKVEPCNIAPGLLMIFHKSVWYQVKFQEHSYIFDKQFSQQCREKGMRIGVAKGLYLFHLYRWGSLNPSKYISHLK